ncbi:hypothetical protein PIB30_045515 [Stylosanthes scabra]|uniref:Uncharacterized protein n=1 Tax=Stylosanthes scabra TaxID=79078 RepID=A0ABU6RG72_9FABA|nr:hypothetical protein [Stylosanthes scabra]
MSAPAAPVAIGTRGTIGSLVKKEIEYFTKFDLDKRGTSHKPQVDMISTTFRSSFWVLLMTGKKRKPRSTNRFLPRMCSVSQVAESNPTNRIPGYNYKILKNDIDG